MSDSLFADRINELLQEQHMSKNRLAAESGASESTIYDITTYGRDSRMLTATCIADVLGVSLDYLTGRTDVREINRGGDASGH